MATPALSRLPFHNNLRNSGADIARDQYLMRHGGRAATQEELNPAPKKLVTLESSWPFGPSLSQNVPVSVQPSSRVDPLHVQQPGRSLGTEE